LRGWGTERPAGLHRGELKVRVDGQLAFNGPTRMLNAALAGLRLAYVPQGS